MWEKVTIIKIQREKTLLWKIQSMQITKNEQKNSFVSRSTKHKLDINPHLNISVSLLKWKLFATLMQKSKDKQLLGPHELFKSQPPERRQEIVLINNLNYRRYQDWKDERFKVAFTNAPNNKLDPKQSCWASRLLVSFQGTAIKRLGDIMAMAASRAAI